MSQPDEVHPDGLPQRDRRPDTSGCTIGDQGMIQVIEEYCTALEAGQVPDREELLARYPEIADELASCLNGLEAMIVSQAFCKRQQ